MIRSWSGPSNLPRSLRISPHLFQPSLPKFCKDMATANVRLVRLPNARALSAEPAPRPLVRSIVEGSESISNQPFYKCLSRRHATPDAGSARLPERLSSRFRLSNQRVFFP